MINYDIFYQIQQQLFTQDQICQVTIKQSA